MANILDGKLLSQTIRQELSKESKAFEQLHGRVPGLAVLLIGENPASKIYVRNKKKACEDCGFYSEVLEFPKDVRQEEIAETICRLNGDDRIDGILIQLPLPDHIDKAALINIIDPQKDVDAVREQVEKRRHIETMIRSLQEERAIAEKALEGQL